MVVGFYHCCSLLTISLYHRDTHHRRSLLAFTTDAHCHQHSLLVAFTTGHSSLTLIVSLYHQRSLLTLTNHCCSLLTVGRYHRRSLLAFISPTLIVDFNHHSNISSGMYIPFIHDVNVSCLMHVYYRILSFLLEPQDE